MTKVPSLSGMTHHQVQGTEVPLPHGEDCRKRTMPATDSTHDGWDTQTEDPSDTFVGQALAQDGKARTPQGEAGAYPFDLTFRDRVRDVHYRLLTEFLVDAHCGRLSLAAVCGVTGPARDAAWSESFEARYEAFSTTEQALLAGAGRAVYSTGECDWSEWLIWTDEERMAAAEELLDGATRGWLYAGICAEYGADLVPHLDHVIRALCSVRFCR